MIGPSITVEEVQKMDLSMISQRELEEYARELFADEEEGRKAARIIHGMLKAQSHR